MRQEDVKPLSKLEGATLYKIERKFIELTKYEVAKDKIATYKKRNNGIFQSLFSKSSGGYIANLDLKNLELTNKDLETLFRNFKPKIQHLNLSGNNLDDTLDITKLFNKVEQLDLSYNDIHDISNLNLGSKIEFLNLSNNKIKNISLTDFNALPLKTLDLSYNNLKKLNIGTNSTKCDKLTVCNLSHNKLDINDLELMLKYSKNLERVNFRHNKELSYKDITSNKISSTLTNYLEKCHVQFTPSWLNQVLSATKDHLETISSTLLNEDEILKYLSQSLNQLNIKAQISSNSSTEKASNINTKAINYNLVQLIAQDKKLTNWENTLKILENSQILQNIFEYHKEKCNISSENPTSIKLSNLLQEMEKLSYNSKAQEKRVHFNDIVEVKKIETIQPQINTIKNKKKLKEMGLKNLPNFICLHF